MSHAGLIIISLWNLGWQRDRYCQALTEHTHIFADGWYFKSNHDSLKRWDQNYEYKGLFLLATIAFWKGHSVARYVCSLAPLTPLNRSAALRFAMLASLARSVHGLAHSLRSLPRGTVEIHESVFMLKSCFTGKIEILDVTRNTPKVFDNLMFFFFLW